MNTPHPLQTPPPTLPPRSSLLPLLSHLPCPPLAPPLPLYPLVHSVSVRAHSTSTRRSGDRVATRACAPHRAQRREPVVATAAVSLAAAPPAAHTHARTSHGVPEVPGRAQVHVRRDLRLRARGVCVWRGGGARGCPAALSQRPRPGTRPGACDHDTTPLPPHHRPLVRLLPRPQGSKVPALLLGGVHVSGRMEGGREGARACLGPTDAATAPPHVRAAAS